MLGLFLKMTWSQNITPSSLVLKHMGVQWTQASNLDVEKMQMLIDEVDFLGSTHDVMFVTHCIILVPSAILMRNCITIWRQVQCLFIMCSVYVSYPIITAPYVFVDLSLTDLYCFIWICLLWSMLKFGNVNLSVQLKRFHFESLQYDFSNHLKMEAVPSSSLRSQWLQYCQVHSGCLFNAHWTELNKTAFLLLPVKKLLLSW